MISGSNICTTLRWGCDSEILGAGLVGWGYRGERSGSVNCCKAFGVIKGTDKDVGVGELRQQLAILDHPWQGQSPWDSNEFGLHIGAKDLVPDQGTDTVVLHWVAKVMLEMILSDPTLVAIFGRSAMSHGMLILIEEVSAGPAQGQGDSSDGTNCNPTQRHPNEGANKQHADPAQNMSDRE